MNNPIYLKQQYQKISKKLHKAFTTGRFYQYTQYKQQRLLDKFSNYSLQLRKLGIAVAIGAGVSMAAPVQGQINWDVSPNYQPITTMDSIEGGSLTFVDIDADGDLDIVSDYTRYRNDFSPYGNPHFYYENIGDSAVANYIKRPRLFNVSDLNRPAFADIDNDGDLDCFAGVKNNYYGTGATMSYFENTGTVTNPTFTQRAGVNNPLDSIAINYSGVSDVTYSTALVDLDNDGDKDFFFLIPTASGTFGYDYYQNIGTASIPNFIKNNSINPLSNITVIQSSVGISRFGNPQFVDMDSDGDLDLFLREDYYENTGTVSAPTFVLRGGATNPFNNLTFNQLNSMQNPSLVDIDGDTDLDLIGWGRNRDLIYRFYENRTIVLNLPKIEEQKLDLNIFPNPTTGIIQLEEPLTGTLEVFNTLGQVLHIEQLEEEQQLNVGHLNSGNYIIKIQTEEGILNEKVVLEK